MGQLCRAQGVWGRVEDITDEEFDRNHHVNPAGLMIGPHVRVHPRLDKEFLASIKTDDVEEVDTVYRNQERTVPDRAGRVAGRRFAAASAEREAVHLGACLEELDLEPALRDRPA